MQETENKIHRVTTNRVSNTSGGVLRDVILNKVGKGTTYVMYGIKQKNPVGFDNMIKKEFVDMLKLTTKLESVSHGKNLIHVLSLLLMHDIEKQKPWGKNDPDRHTLIFTHAIQKESARIMELLIEAIKKDASSSSKVYQAKDEKTYALESICK